VNCHPALLLYCVIMLSTWTLTRRLYTGSHSEMMLQVHGKVALAGWR